MPTAVIARYLLITVFTLGFSVANAADLAPPVGRVLLTVSGNIENRNSDDTVQFDRALLESLAEFSLSTTTPWTEGVTEFTGVRISDLLKYVGANSNSFRAHALDKYWNDVKDIDFEKIPAILAYKKNGKTLRTRELGPLWIMFPFDDFPTIFDEKHKTASVWQLIEIVIN